MENHMHSILSSATLKDVEHLRIEYEANIDDADKRQSILQAITTRFVRAKFNILFLQFVVF